MSLEHWESYYRTGALAACPTGSGGDYDREVREAWADFFAPLPDAAHVLDIGTGNGAVAMIAREIAGADGHEWQIDATDLARIDPFRDVPDGAAKLAGIRFHPGVASERLPFEDCSIDAVSGQYSLEYADMDAALGEVLRVLKPGGRAQFILHHADSALAQSARWSLRQADFVLREAKVYRQLRRVMTTSTQSVATAQRIGAELRATIRSLKRGIEDAHQRGHGSLVLEVTLDAIHKLLVARSQLEPLALEREVGRAEGELRSFVRRLDDLIERTLDPEAIAGLAARARAIGFEEVDYCEQYHAGDNRVGWRLMLQRR